MGIIKLVTDTAGQVDIDPRRVKLISTDNLTTITTAGYLNAGNLQGFSIKSTDIVDVIYNYNPSSKNMTYQDLTVSILNGVITLSPRVSNLIWQDVACTYSALASAGKVIIQPSVYQQKYIPRDIRVNYSTGLSGGGGNRLLSITDGTTVYNNAGITAALLGTAVNTLWGGSGNPLPGTVAMNTQTAAGANLYAQYIGGTTDYTAGSVTLSVLMQRVV